MNLKYSPDVPLNPTAYWLGQMELKEDGEVYAKLFQGIQIDTPLQKGTVIGLLRYAAENKIQIENCENIIETLAVWILQSKGFEVHK